MPKQLENITSRNIEERTVIVDLNGRRMFHQLNSTASFIWNHCTGSNSTEKIASLMASEFDVDEETAKVDVLNVLSEFKALDLITDHV